jgi:uncharacterized membrane protein
MTTLVVGLVVLLGAHSIGVLAPRWRAARVARLGVGRWKLAYSALSIVGLLLVIWGYGMARTHSVVLWTAPAAMRHVAALLAIVAFILVAAAYVPPNHLKSALGHPMTVGVGLWALAHLLVNGALHDVILFGAFLAWALVTYVTRRRRDRAAGTTYAAGTAKGDAIAIVAGTVVGLVFALFLHGPLIGVRPFG